MFIEDEIQMAEETKAKISKKELSPAFLEGQNNAISEVDYDNPYHPSTKKFREYSQGWVVETLSQNENKLAISTNTGLPIEERQEAFDFLQSESTFDNVAGKAYFKTKEGRIELGIRPDKDVSLQTEFERADEQYRKDLIVKLNDAGIKENDKMLSFFSNNKNSYNFIVDSENSNVLRIGINQDKALDAYKSLKDKSDAYIKFTDLDDSGLSYIVNPRDLKKNLDYSLSEDTSDISKTKTLAVIKEKLLKEALTEEQRGIVMNRINENVGKNREKSIQKTGYER